MDENKRWFNMFSLIFEMVSAFAGIGLSLGFPDVLCFSLFFPWMIFFESFHCRITSLWSGP
jgi:Trk-type K+ transport system membrane component